MIRHQSAGSMKTKITVNPQFLLSLVVNWIYFCTRDQKRRVNSFNTDLHRCMITLILIFLFLQSVNRESCWVWSWAELTYFFCIGWTEAFHWIDCMLLLFHVNRLVKTMKLGQNLEMLRIVWSIFVFIIYSLAITPVTPELTNALNNWMGSW